MRHLAIAVTLLCASSSYAGQTLPVPALASTPALLRLYLQYPQLHERLQSYAEQQGFKAPYEQLSTLVHELIHVDSAARMAYTINGQSYEPYGQPTAWPAYSYGDLKAARLVLRDPRLTAQTTSIIYSLYAAPNPQNTLANLADELNAYGQTAQWLCNTAPRFEQDQTARSLADTLRLANAMLMAMRLTAPQQYREFMDEKKQARNLFALVSINARKAAASCSNLPAWEEQTDLVKLIDRAEHEAQPTIPRLLPQR